MFVISKSGDLNLLVKDAICAKPSPALRLTWSVHPSVYRLVSMMLREMVNFQKNQRKMSTSQKVDVFYKLTFWLDGFMEADPFSKEHLFNSSL